MGHEAILCGQPYSKSTSKASKDMNQNCMAFAVYANELTWSTDYVTYEMSHYFDKLYNTSSNHLDGLMDKWHPFAFRAKTYDTDNPSVRGV